MSRLIILSINEFYHIYNRGSDKRKIFSSHYDYERFLILLYLCNSTNSVRINMQRQSAEELLKTDIGKTLVDIGAYCLMPNHFHLLLHEKTENGISLFMQKLTTAYTMYFNKKYDRSGGLFQGTYKAKHADSDIYLKYLFGYIHLNPVKLIEPTWKEKKIKNRIQAEKFLEKYQYSSYPEYTNKKRKEGVIIQNEAFPDYFDKISDFSEMIRFWLEFNDNNNVQG